MQACRSSLRYAETGRGITASRLRRWLVVCGDGLCRGLLAGMVLIAGMPQSRAGTLLTWDLTSTTGSTSGSAA